MRSCSCYIRCGDDDGSSDVHVRVRSSRAAAAAPIQIADNELMLLLAAGAAQSTRFICTYNGIFYDMLNVGTDTHTHKRVGCGVVVVGFTQLQSTTAH